MEEHRLLDEDNEANCEEAKTQHNPINEIIEKLGRGIFSYLLILKLSSFVFIYGAELTLISVISPFLKCEWNLSDVELGIMSSFIFFGMGFGFLLWGWIGDKYGRKPVMIASQLVVLIFSGMSIFSKNYIIFGLTRMFVGIGCASFNIPACILSEYLPIHFRGTGIMVTTLAYGFGTITISWLARELLLENHWQLFIGVATTPALLSSAISFTLPESIRFLVNKSKMIELQKTLVNVALLHKKTLSADELSSIGPYLNQKDDEKISALFSKKRRWKLLAMTVLLSSCLLSYYGFLIWNTDIQQQREQRQNPRNASGKCHKLTRGNYTQNIYVSISGFVGSIGALVVVEILGRKKPIVFTLLLAGIIHMMLNFNFSFMAFTVLMILGRGFISVSLPLTNVFISELFVTSVRAKAFGFCQCIACFFTALVPFLIQDAAHRHMLAVTIVMAFISFIGCVACLTQRETKGRPVDTYD